MGEVPNCQYRKTEWCHLYPSDQQRPDSPVTFFCWAVWELLSHNRGVRIRWHNPYGDHLTACIKTTRESALWPLEMHPSAASAHRCRSLCAHSTWCVCIAATLNLPQKSDFLKKIIKGALWIRDQPGLHRNPCTSDFQVLGLECSPLYPTATISFETRSVTEPGALWSPVPTWTCKPQDPLISTA